MTIAEKAKIIYVLVRRYEEQTRHELIEAKVNHAGIEAMNQAWEIERHFDPDPFAVMGNPYKIKIDHSKEHLKLAEQSHQNATEAMDFATEHFLAMIP